MPWQKQFQQDEVLTRAMNAFWAHGYEATSMSDLVDCMGINRASLYGTFGDKRTLFISALQHYGRNCQDALLEELRQTCPGRRAIIELFERAAGARQDDGGRNGCFVVNTALELAPHDPGIAKIVQENLDLVETFLLDMLEHAVTKGEVGRDLDRDTVSKGLLGLLLGLRVLVRSRPEPALLDGVIDQARALMT